MDPVTAHNEILKQRIEAQKELLSATYSQAMAYTNLIIGAGYAAFFAMWAFTRDMISPKLALWSALLMAISVLTFVLFEVYKSFLISTTLLQLDRATHASDDATFIRLTTEHQNASRKQMITAGRVWVVAFAVAVLTGIGAGLILATAFVLKLVSEYA